ncbi:MAG: Arylsulfatase A family enzyme [Candidatus Methanohalarchaeum thermophilum]|uniref:Arylsulfatase A family enzyme n=1 Tax=Methanohalarchaeum thermophilum TaxID=1903181 RepID=A0A1Q6DSQ2_METT1|nr:MAG: Arylsulfatase A family enzyme [Candidatus Methanohalarchaeum thermophilum]
MSDRPKPEIQPIHSVDWDYLIVLDACRFDFFQEVYEDYLDGELIKVRSRGSKTGEWLVNTFPGCYKDIKYISGNPSINSLGHKIKNRYDPNEHFEEIVDVWDFGWDKNLETVPPRQMNLAYFSNKKENYKFILHYIQPHLPFLHLGPIGGTFKTGKKRVKSGNVDKNVLKDKLGVLLEKIFDKKAIWSFKRVLDIEPTTPYEEIFRKGYLEDILKHYKINLQKVLNSVSNLIGEINGKIVITADHGEALGENGIWEHPSGSELDVLRDIPWLEINK